jgi:hypothetical protein
MSDTDLLERYLQAVGRYLPEGRRADILAELGANLREEMDDREEMLGRPLHEDQVVEVLKKHGEPVMVAARYSNSQPLIGKEVAPFYWFTLQRVAPIVAFIIVVAHVATWVLVPGAERGIGPFIGTLWTALLSGLLDFWATVTLVFAAIEWIYRTHPEKVVREWDPRKLQKVRKDAEGVQKHPVWDLTFSILFLIWLLAFPRFPVLILGPSAHFVGTLSVQLAPVWWTFYWLMVAFNCTQIVLKLATWRSGTEVRRVVKMVEQGLSLCVQLWLLRTHEYVTAVRNDELVRSMGGLSQMNEGIHQVLTLLAVIMAAKLSWDVFQFVRRRGWTQMYVLA